jgi:predicted esterase
MRRWVLLFLFACAPPPAPTAPAPSTSAPGPSTSAPPPVLPVATATANAEPTAAASVAPPLHEAGSIIELKLPKGEPVVVSLPLVDGPQPVMVATHGAGGRAITHCRFWRSMVGARGFVVCPRGHPMFGYEPGGNAGYFYDGHPRLDLEIEHALAAVRAHFGERADMKRPIFAGYSQGASMGSMILPKHTAHFARAVLVEGGFGQFQEWNIASSRRFHDNGGERVLLACGRFKCLKLARTTASYMRKGGLETRVVYGADAGHTYRDTVERELRTALSWLIEGDDRWQVAD